MIQGQVGVRSRVRLIRRGYGRPPLNTNGRSFDVKRGVRHRRRSHPIPHQQRSEKCHPGSQRWHPNLRHIPVSFYSLTTSSDTTLGRPPSTVCRDLFPFFYVCTRALRLQYRHTTVASVPVVVSSYSYQDPTSWSSLSPSLCLGVRNEVSSPGLKSCFPVLCYYLPRCPLRLRFLPGFV